MRGRIIGAYIIMPLTYIACLLVAFLKCIPFNHQWQIYPHPSSELSSHFTNPGVGEEIQDSELTTCRRQLPTSHLDSPDCLRHGYEYRHRLLPHGNPYPHGI